MVYFLSAFYVFAGVMHFVKPKVYLKIIPPFVPYHSAMVIISGVAEIGLGLLLLFPASRPMAAWGIIVLLLLIFPANIYHLSSTISRQKSGKKIAIPIWSLVLRLPLQIVLISWAWMFT